MSIEQRTLYSALVVTLAILMCSINCHFIIIIYLLSSRVICCIYCCCQTRVFVARLGAKPSVGSVYSYMAHYSLLPYCSPHVVVNRPLTWIVCTVAVIVVAEFCREVTDVQMPQVATVILPEIYKIFMQQNVR